MVIQSIVSGLIADSHTLYASLLALMVITCQHLLTTGGWGVTTLTVFQNRQRSRRFCLVHLIRGQIRAGSLQWHAGRRQRRDTGEHAKNH